MSSYNQTSVSNARNSIVTSDRGIPNEIKSLQQTQTI